MKILVIRFYYLGDTILSSVLCNSLRQSFPSAEINYLVYAPYGEVFEHNPSINKLISISAQERRNPFRYLKKAWQISREKYDIIIDAQSSSKSGIVSLLSPQAKYRIGRYKKNRGFAYTHKVRLPEERGNKVQERLDLLNPLRKAGLAVEKLEALEITVTKEEQRQMKDKMQHHEIDFDRPIIVSCVSAKHGQKKWNRIEMARLLEHCRTAHNAQVILFGVMPHELKDVDRVYNQISDKHDIFHKIRVEKLRDVPALFSLCTAFIGNEGGPRHIAQAVGTATVSVFSPHADKKEWLPIQSELHQAIEWRDVSRNDELRNKEFEFGCGTYFKLYNNIKSKDVIPLADDVLNRCTGGASLST